jgi:hypothetical protein
VTRPDAPDLLGLPLQLSRERALALVADLETAWLEQTGSYPFHLASDLDRLAPYFDPLAREATLRRRLDELPRQTVELPREFAVDVGAGRQIVTPEGRVALDLLRRALEQSPVASLDDQVRADALAVLADFYRRLARRRFEKVRALAAGEGAPMLPVAAAFALLLLVNRSTSPDRALDQSVEDPARRAVVDEAFAPALRAFAETLSGEKFKERDRSLGGLSLYQGYAVTEARRRLGQRLRGEDGRLWIPQEDEADVLAFLARDLRRRANSDRILAAFDRLVEQYRATLPRIANLQFAHERPSHTERLRRDLERLLREV